MATDGCHRPKALQSDFRCVTFDNRGMGQSQPAGAEITVSQMAEDTLTVMNAEGIGAAHLVGHSLGGAVVLQVALAAPDRVRSLALLCTSSRGSDATRPTPRMIWLGLRSRLGTRRMRSPQLRALGRFDVTGRLNELPRVPTLVVSAELDIIFPPSCGKALAAGIRGARYVEIPGAAHGVTIQLHETVNRLLHEHFSSARA
jgi:pimeloyl-ACP methyl ester carboxylesterase